MLPALEIWISDRDGVDPFVLTGFGLAALVAFIVAEFECIAGFRDAAHALDLHRDATAPQTPGERG